MLAGLLPLHTVLQSWSNQEYQVCLCPTSKNPNVPVSDPHVLSIAIYHNNNGLQAVYEHYQSRIRWNHLPPCVCTALSGKCRKTCFPPPRHSERAAPRNSSRSTKPANRFPQHTSFPLHHHHPPPSPQHQPTDRSRSLGSTRNFTEH